MFSISHHQPFSKVMTSNVMCPGSEQGLKGESPMKQRRGEYTQVLTPKYYVHTEPLGRNGLTVMEIFEGTHTL